QSERVVARRRGEDGAYTFGVPRPRLLDLAQRVASRPGPRHGLLHALQRLLPTGAFGQHTAQRFGALPLLALENAETCLVLDHQTFDGLRLGARDRLPLRERRERRLHSFAPRLLLRPTLLQHTDRV